MRDTDLYPVTIVLDRYTGSYSEGIWLAFNKEPEDIPEGIFESDVLCFEFWQDYQGIVGKGSSPEEALKDLESKLI